jgi:hypothetical protein
MKWTDIGVRTVAVMKPVTELKSASYYQTSGQFYILCNDCYFPFILITWSASDMYIKKGRGLT